MAAGPFDALFGPPAIPAKPAKPAKARPAIEGETCTHCGHVGVFWSLPPGPFTVLEVVDGRVVRHFHRTTTLADFDEI